jgi:hypothetical protein
MAQQLHALGTARPAPFFNHADVENIDPVTGLASMGGVKACKGKAQRAPLQDVTRLYASQVRPRALAQA